VGGCFFMDKHRTRTAKPGAGNPVGDRPGVSRAVRACCNAHITPMPARRLVNYGVKTAGKVIEVQVHGLEQQGGGHKKPISGWTRKSRLQCFKTTSAVEWEKVGPLVFVTLTYHSVPKNGRLVVRHLEAFRKRFVRRFGECVGEWKREFQSREAVHYHLWLKNPGVPIGEMREWVSYNWWEIVGKESKEHLLAGTQVIEWQGDPISYMLKYVSKGRKEYQHEVPEWYEGVGRWWGLWGLKPEWDQHKIGFEEYVAIRRVLMRLVASKSKRNRKRRGGFSGVWLSSKVNGDEMAVALLWYLRGGVNSSFTEWASAVVRQGRRA
jgi:hypothetical protein